MKRVFLCAICLSVLIASSADALHFGPAPKIEIPDKKLVQFLPTRNEALEKALTVHNLMTELPSLQAMADQQKQMKTHVKEMQNFFDNLMKCNTQRLKRFKNPTEVLSKLRRAYKDRAQKLESETPFDEDSIVPRSLALKNRLSNQKRDIEAELLTDALRNGTKWGGQATNKRNVAVPENLKKQLEGTGLEELNEAESGAINAKMADLDFDNTFQEMQKSFIQKLETVGLQFPDFNAARSADVYKVKKALQDLKEQYLTEAKEYIEKLDQEDAAYPRAVARRTARTKNKKKVLKKVQEEFPEAFAAMEQFDQQSPQQRQRVLVTAMEKDKNGLVYLTETNATEVDQKIAESEANKDMLKNIQSQMQSYVEDVQSGIPNSSRDFDFNQCVTS